MNGERARSAQNGQRQHADSLVRRPSTGPSAEPRQLRQIASDVKSTLGDNKQVSARDRCFALASLEIDRKSCTHV